MATRRDFLNTLTFATVGTALSGCDSPVTRYEQAAQATWIDATESSSPDRTQRRLIHHATLAASSHNTQPWYFKTDTSAITILPNLKRRCPAVDPDNHHLYASLGCATENLIIAACELGFATVVTFDQAGDGAIRVELAQDAVARSPLFNAISLRRSSRTVYDGKAVTPEQLRILEYAGASDSVRVMLLTARPQLENVLDYVVQGNTAQMNDAAFVAELKQWIRFDEASAIRSGDGLFSGVSGHPSIPDWLGRLVFNVAVTASSENDRYREQLRSSSGVAIFVASANDKAHWIESGRACERFCLQAAALGLSTAFINQPVEVAAVRDQFASFLGIGATRPDLIVRFGHGPATPHSLRLPLAAVIV